MGQNLRNGSYESLMVKGNVIVRLITYGFLSAFDSTWYLYPRLASFLRYSEKALQTFPGQSLSRTDVSRTRRFPDKSFPGQDLSRTITFPDKTFPGKTFPGQDVSRTRRFPGNHFPGQTFPGQVTLRNFHVHRVCKYQLLSLIHI